MPHIPLKVTLLNITQNPGELVEQCASISYVTQRFFERTHPARVVFKSGRTVNLSELKLDHVPVQGEVIPGFTKDDKYVYRVEPASYENVVRWLRKLGHWKLFEMPTATFLIEGISRKSALHYLRYAFLTTNMQSQKYQHQDSFRYVLPVEGEESPETIKEIENCYKTIQSMYERLRLTNCDAEWARIVLPNGTAQTMTLHTNFRQWSHILSCLLDEEYVQENKKVAVRIIRHLKQEAPVFFEDFVERDNGSWKVPGNNRNLKVNFGLGSSEKRKLGIETFDNDILE